MSQDKEKISFASMLAARYPLSMANIHVEKIPAALHNKLRRYAREQEVTIGEIVLEAIEREVARREWHKRFTSRPTTRLRSSAARLLEQGGEKGDANLFYSKFRVRSSMVANGVRLFYRADSAHCPRHIPTHNPSYRGEMNAKFLRDLLIAVGPGLVRCPNRFVPSLVLPSDRAELGCRSSLLRLGNINILVAFA